MRVYYPTSKAKTPRRISLTVFVFLFLISKKAFEPGEVTQRLTHRERGGS